MNLLYNETYEIKLIKNKKFEEFKKLKGFNEKKVFSSEYSFMQYCKGLNIGDLLGLKAKDHCLFHNDSMPSASIFKYKTTGDFLYKCHSSKCGSPRRTTNIFGLVCNILDCSFSEAAKALKTMLNCEVICDSNQNNIGQHNIKLLKKYQENFPLLFKLIKSDIDLLNLIYTESGKSECAKENENMVIFSASTRYLEKQLGKNCKVANKLALFGWLSLLDRTGLQSVRVSRYKNSLRKFNNISQITVKRLTLDDLNAAELRAKEFYEKGYTKRNFTFQTVSEKDDVFLANQLFPQYRI